MDKKALLAAATRKLDRQPTPSAQPDSSSADDIAATPSLPAESETSKAKAASRKVQPVVSKGITLRPSNVEKLDKLELSLRKQGIKAGHSGLIQIAIDLLDDNAQLAAAYRELLKLDLRLR